MDERLRGPLPLSLVADAWFEHTKSIWEGTNERHSLSTGYKHLDDVVGGLYNGTLTILAARPSMGKTSLAVNISRHVSKHLLERAPGESAEVNDCVLFFSLEMSRDMLMNNLVSQESGIPISFFRQPHANQLRGAKTAFKEIDNALKRMENWPLMIDDEARTLSRMEDQLRVLSALWTPRLIVVDYLQHMAPEDARASRNDSMGVITRGLKAMAKQYDCPLMLLSQLSRAALFGNDQQIPELHHLRDSGNIENDADNVWFLWRPEYGAANLTAPEEKGVAYALIAKQRQGPRAVKIPLIFDPPTTRFLECPQDLYNTLEKKGHLNYFPEEDSSSKSFRGRR